MDRDDGKTMSRLILNNHTRVDDVQALTWVQEIVRDGRVSDGGKAYCYLTRICWADRYYHVEARCNGESDSFFVRYG